MRLLHLRNESLRRLEGGEKQRSPAAVERLCRSRCSSGTSSSNYTKNSSNSSRKATAAARTAAAATAAAAASQHQEQQKEQLQGQQHFLETPTSSSSSSAAAAAAATYGSSSTSALAAAEAVGAAELLLLLLLLLLRCMLQQSPAERLTGSPVKKAPAGELWGAPLYSLVSSRWAPTSGGGPPPSSSQRQQQQQQQQQQEHASSSSSSSSAVAAFWGLVLGGLRAPLPPAPGGANPWLQAPRGPPSSVARSRALARKGPSAAGGPRRWAGGPPDAPATRAAAAARAAMLQQRRGVALGAAPVTRSSGEAPRGSASGGGPPGEVGAPSGGGGGPPGSLRSRQVLLDALTRLKKKDKKQFFAFPIDPRLVPDYHLVVRNPMDFETMKHKVERDMYPDFASFDSDVALIISNCRLYNHADTPFWRAEDGPGEPVAADTSWERQRLLLLLLMRAAANPKAAAALELLAPSQAAPDEQATAHDNANHPLVSGGPVGDPFFWASFLLPEAALEAEAAERAAAAAAGGAADDLGALLALSDGKGGPHAVLEYPLPHHPGGPPPKRHPGNICSFVGVDTLRRLEGSSPSFRQTLRRLKQKEPPRTPLTDLRLFVRIHGCGFRDFLCKT
ncbi:hypothetical protein Efla_003687 [Eimeria flavescens]